MIRIEKNFQNPPPAFLGQRYEEKLLIVLNERNEHNFTSRLYRDGSYEELKNIYHSKCGYCESNSLAAATLRVDHYRPKNQVLNTLGHIGYYWLGYEWSNLILACEKCNRKKSNHFPIENEVDRIHNPVLGANGLPNQDYRIISSNVLQSERALILNPEIDNVDDHLYFKPNGEIGYLTNKGERTVGLCGLNREDLIIARKKIIEDYRNSFIRILADYQNEVIGEEGLNYALRLIFEKLIIQSNIQSIYSRLGWFMVNKFHLFFSNFLDGEERDVLNSAFKKYLEEI